MTDQESTAMVAEPVAKKTPKNDRRPKKQPRYNVLLWDDDDHSYEYVVLMMRQLFHHSFGKGFEIAKVVDAHGKAICMTTTRELAELKRDQIHAFGRDILIDRCAGSMSASIEPVPE